MPANRTCWDYLYATFFSCTTEELMVLNSVKKGNYYSCAENGEFIESSIVIVPRRLAAIFNSKSLIVNDTNIEVVLVLNYDMHGVTISEAKVAVKATQGEGEVSFKREKDKKGRFNQMIPLNPNSLFKVASSDTLLVSGFSKSVNNGSSYDVLFLNVHLHRSSCLKIQGKSSSLFRVKNLCDFVMLNKLTAEDLTELLGELGNYDKKAEEAQDTDAELFKNEMRKHVAADQVNIDLPAGELVERFTANELENIVYNLRSTRGNQHPRLKAVKNIKEDLFKFDIKLPVEKEALLLSLPCAEARMCLSDFLLKFC